MKITKTTERGIWVLLIVLVAATVVEGYGGWTDFLRLKRRGADYDLYIRNETDGKLVFGTSQTAIGDIELVGVQHVNPLFYGAGADGFVPVAADTDFALGSTNDIMLDSLRYISTDDAAGDSLIIILYQVAAGTPTVLSTDTCATVPCSVDYTGLTDAQRAIDKSANEQRCYRVDVKGTLSNILLEEFYHTYDVQ